MDIIEKYNNGYKVQYMGKEGINILGNPILPGEVFKVLAPTMTVLFLTLTKEELDDLIYEKIILANCKYKER
jgi:hypothetical protein